jgi:hypothetical protein
VGEEVKVVGLRYVSDRVDVILGDGDVIDLLGVFADCIAIPKGGKPNKWFSAAVTPRYVLRKGNEDWRPIRRDGVQR